MSDTGTTTQAPETAADGHALAAAARALFADLVATGYPVVGTGMGEGQIFLRISGSDQDTAIQGAPSHFRGFPVVVLKDHDIRR